MNHISKFVGAALLSGLLSTSVFAGPSQAASQCQLSQLPRPERVVEPEGLPRRYLDTTVKVSFTIDEYGQPHDITVIGSKYQKLDTSFGKIDMNTFFMRLQEQDDTVASWSDSTVQKLKQVLTRVLVENEYIDSIRADHLNPVLISPVLENAIKNENRTEALPAFNCLS